MKTLRSMLIVAGLAAIAAVLLAACARSSGPPAGTPTPRATGTPPATATPSPAPPSPVATALPATVVATGVATAGSATALAGTVVAPGATPRPGPTRAPSPVATAPPTPTPPAGAGPGVYGLLTVGPTCPVQRVDQPCPDRAYPGTLVFEDASGNVAARVTAAADGHYAVPLAPGAYHVVPLSVTGGALPRGAPTDLTVARSGWTRLDVAYDSGIR